MRVRLLRNVRMMGASSVELLAGTVVNATPDVAEKWKKQGLAMEDKSKDGGRERKDKVVSEEAVVSNSSRGGAGEGKNRHKRKHDTGVK